MRSSLTYNCFLDWLPTNWTGIPCLLIDLEIILKISTPVDPIDARSIIFNAFGESEADCIKQVGGGWLIERVGRLQWVNAGSEKRFVCVNIAKPRQKVLIHQERFNRATFGLQHGEEAFWRECWIIRFGSQGGK